MAANHKTTGSHFDYVVIGAAVASGAVVPFTDMIGVALIGGAVGATIYVQTDEVFTLAKKSADVFTQGMIVYWDNTAKNITLTPTSNTRAGKTYAAAGAGVTTVLVKLNAG